MKLNRPGASRSRPVPTSSAYAAGGCPICTRQTSGPCSR